MTSAVLRVKRRALDAPQEALVLLCKRLKTQLPDDTGGPQLEPSVFVFSGTIENPDNIDTHIRKLLPKSEAKFQNLPAPKSVEEILQKTKKQHENDVHESRYEILSCSRGLKEELDKNSQENLNYALVDVGRKTEVEEKDVQYAYDLYFSHKPDFDIAMLDDVVRIEHFEGDLVLGSHRDNGRRSPSSSESSDDSNDENNWRNDYPDTDDGSVHEEDMRRAFDDINIGNDLSSDSGEGDVYNEPPVDPADLNPEDIQRYGVAYAKYKAKVLKNETDIEDKKNLVYCTTVKDLDEESLEGYKDKEDGFYYGMEEDTDNFVSQYSHGAEESEDDQHD